MRLMRSNHTLNNFIKKLVFILKAKNKKRKMEKTIDIIFYQLAG